MLINDCDNCAERVRGTCVTHGMGVLAGPFGVDCDSSYHYLGESPRDFPNASKHDPAVLCGICYRLLRGHRGEALRDREGW